MPTCTLNKKKKKGKAPKNVFYSPNPVQHAQFGLYLCFLLVATSGTRLEMRVLDIRMFWVNQHTCTLKAQPGLLLLLVSRAINPPHHPPIQLVPTECSHSSVIRFYRRYAHCTFAMCFIFFPVLQHQLIMFVSLFFCLMRSLVGFREIGPPDEFSCFSFMIQFLLGFFPTIFSHLFFISPSGTRFLPVFALGFYHVVCLSVGTLGL